MSSSTSQESGDHTMSQQNTTQLNHTASTNHTANHTAPVDPCKSGQYLNAKDKQCYSCHKSCLTCNGPNKGDCTSCAPRMYFVKNSKDGNVCVGNCESVGLFYDATNNICVGCHPACSTCFGPENEQCFECNDGFVQVDKYTCDTECFPENSYIVNKTVCQPCNLACKSCYGPEITQCHDCYPPYSFERSENECVFNYTLAEIYNTKYRPPMSIWTKISIYMGLMVGIVAAVFLIKYLRKRWLDYQANKDRSYNVFDKAELNNTEKGNMKKWNFAVPVRMQDKVQVNVKQDDRDHEIEVNFSQQNQIYLIKSTIAIPPCTFFRYFEVDVLENKKDATVFVGIIEERDPFFNQIDNIDQLSGLQTLIINGLEGTYVFGQMGRKIQKSLTLKEMGDSVGICMHYQTADEIAMEIADDEIEKGSKKKKEQLVAQYKKDMGLTEQIRLLIFKDGMVVSSADQLDKDKIKIDRGGKYYIFVGSDGPCQISVNVGGKIFRAHHDEINRGLIVGGSSVSRHPAGGATSIFNILKF
eukprot:403362821